MCHSDSSRPPAAPGEPRPTRSSDLQLTASDGNTFAAFGAWTAQPTGRGIVVMPDVRGLHRFYKELAARFAETGVDAVAIDYFGRSTTDSERNEGFAYQEHVKATTPEMVAADVRAGVEHLRTVDGGGARKIFSVGFCWGGSGSWRQSAEGHGLAGSIGFYGGRPLASVAPWIPKMAAPLLMLLAENDGTPPEEFVEFASQVRQRGIEVESHTFAGTPHSFFDRTMAEHRQACDEAWRRILEFIDRRST